MPSLQRIRKKSKKSVPIQRWIGFFFKLILSPIVIVCDLLRRKGVVDNTWVFSYMLFLTLVMVVTSICYVAVETPIDKSLNMLAMASGSKEIMPGDVHPVIAAINKYALKEKIDPMLIFAIIKVKSNFIPNTVSTTGEMGLMQLKLEVWKKYSGSVCLGRHNKNESCSENCIFNPTENIRVGVKYFRNLLDKYGGRVDLALTAYDAGIDDADLDPETAVTEDYLDQITSYWSDLRKQSITTQLKMAMSLKQYLRWMFGICFLLWLILFYWINRKIFTL